ncbi:MAG: glycosyltransferase family 2 protein [Verrucomicrobia bacterium]|nr:glycosyltransferase family 2 protein [Verrucomicrobiota bacterium]MCH8512948.1 glycosyltransferase family 2 protein [Kiritimatiellia bacterium]
MRNQKLDFIVVMPVYNEAEVIDRVTREWLQVLERVEADDWRLRIYNDGSRDDTGAILDAISHERLEVIHAPNQGHGPTLIAAYRRAVTESDWVFQSDSDGEIAADTFPEFWRQREEGDLWVGHRQNRGGPLSRRFISAVLRWMNRVLYGPGISDVNCPCRLFRSQAFAKVVEAIPEKTFAPNVLISGMACTGKMRVRELPVSYTPRQTGEVSIRKGRLAKAALLSTWQTLKFRLSPAMRTLRQP